MNWKMGIIGATLMACGYIGYWHEVFALNVIGMMLISVGFPIMFIGLLMKK